MRKSSVLDATWQYFAHQLLQNSELEECILTYHVAAFTLHLSIYVVHPLCTETEGLVKNIHISKVWPKTNSSVLTVSVLYVKRGISGTRVSGVCTKRTMNSSHLAVEPSVKGLLLITITLQSFST